MSSLHSSSESAMTTRISHDATDSGYGGSIVDSTSIDSENLFEKSFSSEVHHRQHIISDKQQEIYQENCQLLTTSIDETKQVLKVSTISRLILTRIRISSHTMRRTGLLSILKISSKLTAQHPLLPLVDLPSQTPGPKVS
jgi:hypothetical protein